MIKWEIIIPVFVAVIASIGGIIPVLLNSIHDKPDVYSDIPINRPNFTKEVIIGNKGSAPATNVSLIIHSKVNISNFTNQHSGSDIFEDKGGTEILRGKNTLVNSKILELFTPVLTQGSGSTIDIILFFDQGISESPKNNNTFTLDLNYDQGSLEITSKRPMTIPEVFKEFILQYAVYYVSLVMLIGFAIVALITHHLKKKAKKNIIFELIQNLLKIREKLDNDITTTELYHAHELSDVSYEFFGAVKISKIMTNVKDYIVIRDLLKKADERDYYLRYNATNLDPHRVEELNHKCLKLVNKALEIDWEKYK